MPIIEFTDTSVTYPGGLVALKNIDLEFEPGEFVVVVGLSGAGKSTLLRCVNGLVPVAGSVVTDGMEVVGASRKELREIRSKVGMIFQTFNLVNRSRVLTNVLAKTRRSPSSPSSVWASSRRRTSERRICPAGSSSGSASPGPLPRSPTSSSPTSRWHRSTR
jgi:phosphonate transport system ATP-binding protein